MDLRRKIARLALTSLSSREENGRMDQYHRLRRQVLETGVAGYVVFGGNIGSVAEIVEELAESTERPLIVASDLERGLGQQLEGGTVFPPQMAVGAAGDPDLALAQGWVTAAEARAIGVNLIFAPVADVASEIANPIIGVRSYGGDPGLVASCVAGFVRGCQSAGVATTAKHFPGHGDTRRDSHIELPTVDADRVLLEGRELAPFRAAVDAGARAVMTAHVAYPALDGSGAPASFSRPIVTGLLREEMGFDGVVVTDALLMGAVTRTMSQGEAAVAAIEAGADLLLMPADLDAAVEGIREAVESGRLPEERIDLSLARVDSLLEWRASVGSMQVPEAVAAIDLAGRRRGAVSPTRVGRSFHHDAVALEIAGRGITLLRDRAGMIPLDPDGLAGAKVACVALVEDDRPPNLVWLRSQMNAALPGLTVESVDRSSGERELSSLVRLCQESDRAVLAVFDDVAAWRGRAGPSPELLSILSRFLAARPDVAVLAFTGPEIGLLAPDAGTVILCYDGSPACQIAAARALFGRIPIAGRLPVELPERESES